MQLRRTTWGLIAGSAIVLALSANAAGAAPPSTGHPAAKAPASASGASTGASGSIHGAHLPSPSTPDKAARPTVHPANSPNAAYRQYTTYWNMPNGVPAGATVWGEVYCPAGMLATGGGESNSSLDAIFVRSSYAKADGSGWHVDVTNSSASTVGVTVWAVCFSGLTVYKQVTQPTVALYSDYAQTNITCSQGTAVGGGGWTTAGDQYVSFIGPAGGALYFGIGYAVAGGPPAVAQAICVSGINNLQWVGYSGTQAAPGQEGSASGNCPA
ncbi:MAG TPA: hypothetical protein VGL21_14035, partial [Jatrophihabitantaceae bacterium]